MTVFQVSLNSLKEAWQSYKKIPKKVTEITGQMAIEKQRLEELADKLINLTAVRETIKTFDFKELSTSAILEVILAGAVANRASDIHFEPEAEAIKIRYRIDGVLNDIVDNFSKSFYRILLSRIKLLAGLKLDASKPQDGRFTFLLIEREIELRVSLIPAKFGEIVVIRILDPDIINIPLNELGMREDDLEIILKELREPNGMILNTGPTGSGKTTTLYSFLQKRKSPKTKIITIEDPIEYSIKGIEQTQVNPEGGYTFANGLSFIVRQDPDIILVGEIRDEETAAAAIQAALTGHLVFSTVHANTAAGAIPRLLDLNIKPASIGPAINLIIAQRLVRRLCGNCRELVTPGVDLAAKIGKFLDSLPDRIDKEKWSKITLYKPIGCPRCSDSGYKGRIGIFELLMIGKEIETLIEKQVSETELQEFVLKQGWLVTMQQDGILKALAGITTLAEVEEVTGHLQL